MIYGIPNFKLEKDIVLRRWTLLEQAGIVFHLGCEVGRDVSLHELRARHASVLIATGVYRARDIGGPGAGLPGIVPALDFLTASNRQGLGDAVPDFASGALDAAGRDVVVVGGGDTAMDCVRTAVRQGATSVRCLYRRDRANMPGSMREVGNAEEEGVQFVWLTAPEAFLGNDAVTAVRAVKMRLGLPDASGRQSVELLPGSAHSVPAQPGHQGAGLRPGGSAGRVRRAGAGGEPLGHPEGRSPQLPDQPAGRVRRRRHRARRLAGGLGDPRRTRRGGCDARLHAAGDGGRRGDGGGRGMMRVFALALLLAGGAAGVARAEAPTAAAIDVARQILREDGSYDALSATISAKRAADIKATAKLFGMSDARATLFVDKFWIPEMKARLQDYVDVGAQIYASKVSAADLQAIAAFLQTPAGQKMVTVRAEVGRELTSGVRAWQHGVMVDALKKLTADSAAHPGP